MYIIKMTDNKELINCSYDKKIYQKETLVDELMFLVPHKYAVANASTAGLVKSTAGANKVGVAGDGTMSVASITTDIIANGANTLILNGGGAV